MNESRLYIYFRGARRGKTAISHTFIHSLWIKVWINTVITCKVLFFY